MKRRKFLGDILGFLGTRTVGLVMGVVGGVILARWLGPYDRGILALVLLVSSTVATLVKFGVSQANVYHINRKNVSVDRIASNALVIAIVMGIVSALVVWSLRGILLDTILKDVPAWALAIALARVPLLLLDNYLFSILQALGRFGTYNIRLLISEATRLLLVALALIVFKLGLAAAVFIYLAVGLMNVVWLMLTMSREIHFSLSIDRGLLAETLAFGGRSYAQVLTMHMLQRISFYMVSAFLGPAQIAFYAIALRFTELVLEIPQAVGLVLYSKLASLPEDRIHGLTAQACRRTLMITVPVAASFAWLGPYVVVLWYGEAYAPAAEPLPWAAVAVAMMSIFVIITRDFTSRAKQRVNIIAGVLALVSNVALNFLLIPTHGIVGSAIATAASYTAASVVLIVFFLRESRLSIGDILLPKREDFRYFVGVVEHVARKIPGVASLAPRG